MIITVTENIFMDYFKKSETYRDNFSYEGLKALFEYFDNSDCDNIELDIVSICCDFTETTIDEALANYGLSDIDELESNTLVLRLSNDNIIYQNY